MLGKWSFGRPFGITNISVIFKINRDYHEDKDLMLIYIYAKTKPQVTYNCINPFSFNRTKILTSNWLHLNFFSHFIVLTSNLGKADLISIQALKYVFVLSYLHCSTSSLSFHCIIFTDMCMQKLGPAGQVINRHTLSKNKQFSNALG